MGDHRAHIRISFELHGKKYKKDMSINYNGFDGVDQAVIEFFEEAWSDGVARYEERRLDAKIRAVEREERLQLKRLKKKYEAKPTISSVNKKRT